MPPNDDSQRPSPDALLEEAHREARGRLKVFLGAAPGVGKTYAMLQEAQERLREGVDVVAGVVETHGRHETEALMQGLAVVPRCEIEYRGRTFREMDLDAVLARRPRLVLVDELAHTNVPGSRHLKRWRDVEELLDAGIDVYSTLNVQHLESLNDVVERITGVKVRETVPDGVLARADEIELIDTPPQELLKRLGEGKVYVPEQAQRAMAAFFQPGNLTALRELALRSAADRVDAQMLRYMRAHAIAGPWPTRERILVCLDDGAAAQRLVRTARRAAERRQAPWVALYVETYRHQSLSEEAKDAVSAALRLAEELGAETTVVQGDDVAAEILAQARARNVTQIIVGRERHGRWPLSLTLPLPFRRTVTRTLLDRAEGFDVTVVAREDERPARRARTSRSERREDWKGLAVAFGVVAAATGLASVLHAFLPLANIPVVFLTAVVVIATRFGLRPSIFASFLSFLAFNFFFTEPSFTFAISDSRHVLTIAFFLLAAVIVSNLAARVRAQVDAVKLSARRTSNLYEFSRRIAAAASQDDVLWAVVHHVAASIGGHSLVLLPDAEGRLQIRAGYPPEDRLDDKSAAAADWSWAHGEPAGRGSATLPTAAWLFLPLRTGRGPMGVLGVQVADGAELLSPEQGRLLDTVADQAALALERTALVSDVERARVATERERLRSALLSSLSHDLRTPLVSIMGAASSLLTLGRTLDDESRDELAQTIQEEAERLNRFVQNLLDMTRLGSGSLKPRTDWVDLREVAASALERAKKLLRGRKVKVDIDPDLPLLRLDYVLMEQVLFNLLDNACKYSPDRAPVTIWARHRDGHVAMEVCDQGPGIAPEARESVFDMFYRVDAGDSQTAGTGLGLAICRGIIEAHGGRISAQPGLHGAGTCIVITLPAGEQADRPEEN